MWEKKVKGKEGANVVVFRTCLYVDAAAFIREFLGSPLVWWAISMILFAQTYIAPINRHKPITLILPNSILSLNCCVTNQ